MAIQRLSFEEYEAGCMYHPKRGCVHVSDEGRFISSLTNMRPSRHAPALDIDFPTTVELNGAEMQVTIAGPMPTELALHSLLGVMVHVGLMHETDARRLLPDACTKNRVKLPTLPLNVLAQAYPSSTTGHFHLFLEKEMPWDDYKNLLIALRDADVIGQDFAAMCLEWRVSFLLKPEYKKSDFKLKFETPAPA